MRFYQYFGLITIWWGICGSLLAYPENAQSDNAEWESLQKQIEIHRQENPDSVLYYLQKADTFAHQNDLNITNQVFLINAWGDYYIQTQSQDSALFYFRQAVMTSQNEGSPDLINAQKKKLAQTFNNYYMADSALYYYRSALSFYQKSNDSLALSSILSGMATALIESGKNKEALEKLFEAEKILENTTEYRELGIIYDNIALINARFGYEDKIIQFGKKAIAQYQKAGDTTLLADAYANLGVSYKNLNQYDTALGYYEKSNTLARKIKSKWLLAKNLHNIGVVHNETGDHSKAAESFTASLKVCREENFLFGEFNNSINLGEHEMNHGDVQQAIRYFNRAVEIGKQENFDKLGLVYDKLHLAHDQAGQTEDALDFLRKYAHFRDSAFTAQKHLEIMDLQTRYETQKKETQILNLEKEKESEKLLRAYLMLGFVGVVIIALFLLMQSWRKNARIKQNAYKLEKANAEKRAQMEKLELEKKLQEEAAEKYRLDLKLKQQELVCITLKEAGMSHLMKKVNDQLKPFTWKFARKKDQNDFTHALQEISQDTSHAPLSDFEDIFIQMHDGFYEKLLEINSDFTRSELQMAALLRMNLPSKEIARLLNLALSTIDKRRHHIRQKIGLTPQQSLTNFLIGL